MEAVHEEGDCAEAVHEEGDCVVGDHDKKGIHDNCRNKND